jgi:hypothetical protein
MNRPDIPLLVCAPADSEYAMAGSTFGLTCMNCGRRLMLSPSGASFLNLNPGAVVQCWPCFKTGEHSNEPISGLIAENGSVTDRLVIDSRDIKPNLRRYRN